MDKKEYHALRGLWFKNSKPPYALPICDQCANMWDVICREQEPMTEYQQLSRSDKHLVIQTMYELDR